MAYINPNKRETLHEIADSIDNHPESSDRLDDLAKRVQLNPHYVNRLFKNMYGLPIQKYRCAARIKRAKWMLCETDMAITDIALQLNFSTGQHFSNTFKREVGLSPQDYRKLNKKVES